MCPLGGRWVNPSGRLVGHVLAIETDRGDVVLVDTGLGTADHGADRRRRLGLAFTSAVRPERDLATTALRRLEALGIRPGDVRDIVVTHLDVDHAGGLPDFPHARVHVHASEQRAALAPRLRERSRYRRHHWAHGPRWAPWGGSGEGEQWAGFSGVQLLVDGVLGVPLPGHSRGHAAIAVDGGDRWLLHAGDAYFDRASLAVTGQRPRWLVAAFERSVAVSQAALASNHERLAEVVTTRSDIEVFCAHDPDELPAVDGGHKR
jgi:glyoxylase-like metal-dependent hydrolase (beta-lactamase superfamily II)